MFFYIYTHTHVYIHNIYVYICDLPRNLIFRSVTPLAEAWLRLARIALSGARGSSPNQHSWAAYPLKMVV